MSTSRHGRTTNLLGAEGLAGKVITAALKASLDEVRVDLEKVLHLLLLDHPRHDLLLLRRKARDCACAAVLAHSHGKTDGDMQRERALTVHLVYVLCSARKAKDDVMMMVLWLRGLEKMAATAVKVLAVL